MNKLNCSGLAVMGQNLILNMNDHGYVVVAYNRTTAKVDSFLANEVTDKDFLADTARYYIRTTGSVVP